MSNEVFSSLPEIDDQAGSLMTISNGMHSDRFGMPWRFTFV